MKIAYLDAHSGVAGDMLLGALLDLGWPLERLREGLRHLPLDGGVLVAAKTKRGSLAATHFSIRQADGGGGERGGDGTGAGDRHDHGHGHGHAHAHPHEHDPGHEHAHGHDDEHTHGHEHGDAHDHAIASASSHPHAHPAGDAPHRHYSDLQRIVRAAALPPEVEERSLAALRLIAEAESRAHDVDLEQVHFHEIGAVDTLVDVCGTLLGFHELGVGEVYSSAIAVGSGTVRCEHGVLPVPAPGALQILLGIPIRSGGLTGERTTPTGAALVKVLVNEFEPALLRWTPEATGMGAGTRDDPAVPNLLRVTLGRRTQAPAQETVLEISCEVDHVSGEVLGHTMERLFAAGALDVFFVPVQMKKNRPGTLIVVLAGAQVLPQIESVLFYETGTLGVRRHEVARTVLPRSEVREDTEFGPVRFKVRELPDGSHAAAPEFEDLKRIAVERGLPLAVVAERLRRGRA